MNDLMRCLGSPVRLFDSCGRVNANPNKTPKLFLLQHLRTTWNPTLAHLAISMFRHLVADLQPHHPNANAGNPDGAAAAGDEVDAAAAAAPRGSSGGIFRGRAKGYTHSACTKAKISASRQKGLRDQEAEAQRTAIVPGSLQLVQNVFGPRIDDGPRAASSTVNNIVAGCGQLLTVRTNSRDTHLADRDRAVASHIKAQSDGFKRFLRDEFSLCHHYVNMFDDASMWMSFPMSKEEIEARKSFYDSYGEHEQAALKKMKRLQEKGKMVHMPVLNLIERVSKSRLTLGAVAGTPPPCSRGLELHSPAIPLPKANYSTVFDRWSQWTAQSGNCHTGQRLDPSSPLGGDDIGVHGVWATLGLVSDCLTLNANIVAKVQERARLAKAGCRTPAEAAAIPTPFHVHCCAHSSVLCLKPIVHREKGLSSFIVRCGHLCQSGRSRRLILDAMDAHIEENFLYRRVQQLPAGHAQWTTHASSVLELTSCSGGMPDDLKQKVLYFDNGNWKSPSIIHYCVDGCMCGRSKANALRVMKHILKLSIGANCSLALEYRWKTWRNRTPGAIGEELSTTS